METILPSVINFGIYFFGSLAALLVFKYVYCAITPHDEWKLIKDEKNTTAAIGFGGGILGFAIALSGAASNSVSLLDFVVWSVIALIAQSTAFALVRFVFMPLIVRRIETGEISAGIMLAAMSIAVGILNAACMTY